MKRKTSIIYNRFHKETSVQTKIIPDNSFTYRIILRMVNRYLKNNANILDIGCGAGTLCLYYASKGNRMLGIDISKKAIDAAKKSAEILGLGECRFRVMDFPRESPSEKFDLIILTEVIEHLQNDKNALKRAYSLLRSKGAVIITAPSKNAPLFKLGLANEFDERVGHLRRYTIEEMTNLCRQIGFNILETGKTEGIIRNFLYLNPTAGKLIRFIKFFFVDVVMIIDYVSMRLFGESDIFIIAQKP